MTDAQKGRIRRWVEALRSGKYAQTSGKLRGKREEEDGAGIGYCCLGVACDLYANEEAVKWDSNDDFLGRRDFLPRDVRNWYGLPDVDPDVEVEGDEDAPATRSASDMNDSGKSFDAIADAIERTYLHD